MINLPVSPGYRKLVQKEYITARSCYIITAGEEMIYSRRFLEYCEIIYVMAGKLYIAVSGREYTVNAGEVLVIPCYQTVDGVRRSDVKTTFCTCEFSCSDGVISDIAGQIVAIREDEYLISKQFARLNQLLSAEGHDDNHEGDVLCLSILYGIRNNIAHGTKNNLSILNSVMEYINENIDKMLTVEDIAEHFGYNKDYLLRLFRERYGITVKKYINEKKMTMVKRILITTDMSVAKVGAAIGFEETELFEKFFKYHEKVTPQRYRKMNR